MSADYLGQVDNPVHFKRFWKPALAEVHQNWTSLTSTPELLDVNEFPASRVLVMTRAE